MNTAIKAGASRSGYAYLFDLQLISAGDYVLDVSAIRNPEVVRIAVAHDSWLRVDTVTRIEDRVTIVGATMHGTPYTYTNIASHSMYVIPSMFAPQVTS